MARKTTIRPVDKAKPASHIRGKPRNSRTVNKRSVNEGFNASAGVAAPAAEAVTLPEPRPDGFPIVGVGASAGGLEAFTELLKALPTDTGMAFVLVQHLDPKHESMLSEILSRSTAMAVREVNHATRVEPNHVYVTARGVDLYIRSGVLQVTPRKATRDVPMPIDYFFRSLAEELGNKAIGVILSGTGSDGSLGLKAIKAETGITFAQEEKSAKYDGMPHSAIAAGCVDFVLPPADIARELSRIHDHPYVAPRPAPPEEIIPVSDDALSQILQLVRVATGVDLVQYKPTTIKRRILRRMLLNKLDSLEKYLVRLRTDTAEVHALFEDILINVTQFFRDPDTFQALKADIFPKIVGNENINDSVRIWVPGCSTGEEVYSLAIALLEYLEEGKKHVAVQLFGTDISDSALERARAGLYTPNIATDVSSGRLKRFFVKADGGYQISKHIRDLCVFAKQDVTRDPPFSKLDLLSCRNVLIYLGPALQKRVLPVFHYALKSTGYLLLGNSETLGSFTDMFRVVDKKHKFFAKKVTVPRVPVEFNFGLARAEPQASAEGGKAVSAWTATDLQREADRIILSRFGPSGVVINEDLDVLQFRGQTGIYLEPSPGPASYNILKMAREGLLADLRSLLHRVRTSETRVHKEGLRVKYNGSFHEFNLEIIPIWRPPQAGRFFMILFHPVDAVRGKTPVRKEPRQTRTTERDEVRVLRQELGVTKETLQAIIEEQEATNEELRSANEEIQSSNEELQSTNEELETAKEELQSSNEELNTVNEELQNRNSQLAQANDDLHNLLSNANLPIIMVGSDLCIRQFTPQAEKVMGIIASDIGRPIANIRPNVNISNLEQKLAEVIETLHTHESEVQDSNGRWYLFRIRPYRTEENKIEGTVLVLVDIDDIKRSGDKIRLITAHEDERRKISRELHDALNQEVAMLEI
ncbi:MAG TPA: chemotaxis protein CheB, partial [Bryobacteraceae bacterium]|nr:chemotaxis protein CheB [Bryobacteraceae bacterium]